MQPVLGRWTRLAAVGTVVLALAATGLVASSGKGETPQDHMAARVIAAARQQLGDGYVWGGNGPDQWDCSGLTSVLWRDAGVKDIPRVSRDQQAWAWPIRASQRRPGDLIFFGDPVTHVSIYVGNGKVIDASSANKKVLERPVWSFDVVRYGRVPRAGIPKPPPPPRETVTKTIKSITSVRRMGEVPAIGTRPAKATSRSTQRFVDATSRVLGRTWSKGGHGPKYDAAGLVRWAWASSGHRPLLPRTPAAIERYTTPVELKDLRVGDLVFYGLPSVHVGIYVGNGFMVDASKALGKVVRRPVFVSDTVRFARLKGTR